MGTRWAYRLPRPHAAALLCGMGDKDDVVRMESLQGYIEHVLMPESVDVMWERAFTTGDPFDVEDMAALIEAIQGRHSARPFHVDVSLSATAVKNWHSVRGRLVMAGVSDPLKSLPNIYALLDAVEAMILDGMGKEEDRDRYFRKLYAPPPGSSAKGVVPKGFSAEEELAAFEAWGD